MTNMTNPPHKLFLLDAMALIYRAFYALNKNPRINSKGLNTSAILGFANTLFRCSEKREADAYRRCLRHDGADNPPGRI